MNINWFKILKEALSREYVFGMMVTFDRSTGNLDICGDLVKWLGIYHVRAITAIDAETEAFKLCEEEYPEYKRYIQVYSGGSYKK